MRYLSSALVSEGPSDDRLLPRLLGRALDDLCATEFEDVVEIPEITLLRAHPGPPSVDQIIELADRNTGSFYLIFVHRDQAANRARLDRDWIHPLISRWGDRRERLVMVVPVRETEAWALADGDALRRALGVRWSDADLGVPARPGDVEKIADPKVPLDRVGARIGRPVHDYFERLAELVSLQRLKAVPSFVDWWDETAHALAGLGYRRRVNRR